MMIGQIEVMKITKIADGLASRKAARLIGSQFTNMGRELDFLLPVYVGDHLSTATRTADIFIKPTRLDPESLWIVNEDIITNQNDEVVCRIRNTLMNFRTPDELKAAGVTP